MLNTALELTAIIGIFGVSCYLILKNFGYALYVLLFLSVLLHKELFSFYRWDLMPVRAFMLGLLIVGTGKLILNIFRERKIPDPRPLIKDPVIVVLVLLWIVRGISIINTLNLQASLFLFGFFTSIVALAIFMNRHFSNQSELPLKYIKTYVFITFGLVLFGFLQYFYHYKTGHIIGSFWVIPGNTPRVGSLFWDVNHYGSLLAALLPFTAVQILLVKGFKKRFLYSAIVLLATFSLFLTNSRTAWIIGALAFGFFCLILLIRRFGAKGILLLTFIFTIALVPPIVEYNRKDSPFRVKIKHYLNYRIDSFDSHMLLLTGAYQVFEEYPIIGSGYGGFFEHFSETEIAPTFFSRDPAALNTRVPAHTIWGELLAETGIIGFSLFLLFALILTAYFAYIALKSKNRDEILIGAALFGTFLGWMCAGVFYSYNAEFFWLLVLLYYFYAKSVLVNKAKLSDVIDYFVSSRALTSALILVSFLMIFLGLGHNSLIPWDEAIYAKIAKNMMMDSNYLVMHWIPGKIWYEKPPLLMWSISGLFKLLGYTSLAAKLPSAMAGFGTIVATYFFSKRIFTRRAALITTLSLTTTVSFILYSRMAMTDVLCTFFITLSLYAFYFSTESKKGKMYFWLVLSGIFSGLAVMTKGVVGLIPLVIIGLFSLYLLFSNKSGLAILRNAFITIVVSILVFLPWHLKMFQLFGDVFINNYLGYHVFERATEAIEDKGQPIYWYLIVIKVSMRLWFISLLGAFPFVLYNIFKRGDTLASSSKKILIFITLWSLTILAFFSLAQSKLVWYIIPIYVPLALLNGYFIDKVYSMLVQKVTIFSNKIISFVVFYVFTIIIFGYTFIIRDMIYVSDTTGAPARLLQLKDSTFGVDQFVYVDRLELPLAYYYTDGPFKIIDFNASKRERIPDVDFSERLVLLTKTGRFEENLPDFDYPATVVQEDGDYILWYFTSKESYYTQKMSNIDARLADLMALFISKYPDAKSIPVQLQNEYADLTIQKLETQDILDRK